jgi:hypothetical protein
MRKYEIRYHVLPAGLGPDDYETKDLEERTGIFEFPDAAPEDTFELLGKPSEYGPAYPDVKAAIAATLQPGETPLFSAQTMRRVD